MTFVDQESLVIASAEGRIDLGNVHTGRRIRSVGEHATRVTSLSVSPDGSRLASSGLDQSVKVWESEQTKRRLVFCEGTKVMFMAWDFSPIAGR